MPSTGSLRSTLARSTAALGLLAAGCGPPGAAVRGLATPPAVPDEPACTPAALAGTFDPLVVDWPATVRGDLEAQLRDGVAVLAYSCEGVRVLRDCRLPGEYGYQGFSLKRDGTLIEGADAIRASVGGLSWGVAAHLERSARLDLATAIVGKLRAGRASVARDELEGGAACEGATHFVRQADLGAFAVVVGVGVREGAAAAVLGQGAAQASQARDVRTRSDGDPAACAAATASATAPPEGCRSVVRVSLRPLDAAGAALVAVGAGRRPDGRGCVEGYVRAGDACVRRGAVRGAYLCAEDDRVECAAQCRQGDLGSCGRWAKELYWWARRGSEQRDEATLRRETTELTPLLDRACAADEAFACILMGALSLRPALEAQERHHREGREGPPPAVDAATAVRMLTYVERACAAGEPEGCLQARFMATSPELAVVEGAARYVAMLERTCAGASPAACTQLAVERVAGGLAARDGARAVREAARGCQGGVVAGCLLQAGLRSSAAGCTAALAGVARGWPAAAEQRLDFARACEDDVRAAAAPDEAALALARACRLGEPSACASR